MIKISIARDKDRFIRSFTIKGHAGYSGIGTDIVCAAVSAIAYTALGGLEELAGIKGYSEAEGYMEITLPDNLAQEEKYTAWVILETAVIGFEQIQYKYSDHVKIYDEEV